MTRQGTCNASNYPPGCTGPDLRLLADAVADLRLMLAPLAALPGMVLPSGWDEWTTPPDVIDATLELQLDPAAPARDLVAQLQKLAARAEGGGGEGERGSN